MLKLRFKYLHIKALVTFLVALALLCAGIRVPDLSRPHRPKPSHRVVFETKQKPLSGQVKQLDDFAAVLPQVLLPGRTVSCRSHSPVAPPLHVAALFASNSGRSPPA